MLVKHLDLLICIQLAILCNLTLAVSYMIASSLLYTVYAIAYVHELLNI